jgi:hypothetical protein
MERRPLALPAPTLPPPAAVGGLVPPIAFPGSSDGRRGGIGASTGHPRPYRTNRWPASAHTGGMAAAARTSDPYSITAHGAHAAGAPWVPSLGAAGTPAHTEHRPGNAAADLDAGEDPHHAGASEGEHARRGRSQGGRDRSASSRSGRRRSLRHASRVDRKLAAAAAGDRMTPRTREAAVAAAIDRLLQDD